jgi:hypothetical protein
VGGGLPSALAPRNTRRVQILGLKAIAKIEIITRQLEGALVCQCGAFEGHDSQKYAAAVAMAEDARAALASIPALTVPEILAKAKAMGPVPAAALASLSEGESALVASIIRDVYRMAESPIGAPKA